MSYCYDYPRPALAADVVLIAKDNGAPKILLIQRLHDPFKDAWAFPGGFMDMDETIENAAVRELEEETSLVVEGFQQFKVVSKVDRDPRGRVVSVVFLKVIDDSSIHEPKAQDDAKEVVWHELNALPELAFDHGDTLSEIMALEPWLQ